MRMGAGAVYCRPSTAWVNMPLDEREQRILEEIERRFYEDDPKLAETVRTASVANVFRRSLQKAAVGFILGLALMLLFFTRNTYVALAGFGLMVVSGWLAASSLRRRVGTDRLLGDVPSASSRHLFDRIRGKWRRPNDPR